MNQNEKEEFAFDITNQVQQIINKQTEANKEGWINFNNEMRIRLEETLPNVVSQIMPKNNYWFPLLNSVINGLVVGISIYVAMYLFSA